MNDFSYEENLLMFLLQLKLHINNTPDVPKYNGICDYINITFMPKYMRVRRSEYNQKLLRLFGLWPEFSGSYKYPVQNKYEFCGESLSDAYSKACNEGTLWDQSTEYGKARMRLLNWMIERLTFELGIY